MIDIIVPTYNESESIEQFLKVLKKEVGKLRVIIIDDSTDNTITIARKICKNLKIKNKIIKRKNKKGKGSAVNKGLSLLKSEYGAIIDADLEYHPKYIKLMMKQLKKYDFVTSVRIREDQQHRKILGLIFKSFVTLLFKIPFETQSGLKVFKTKAVKDINLMSKGWVFDVELINKLLKSNKKVGTYNIKYTTRKLGKSKINFFTPIHMFFDIIKLRLKI